MESWTYLLINLGAISVPLIYSFHSKLKFNVNWKAALSAITLTLIPFIIWDAYFTDLGIWWFHNRYTLGPRILDLPIEEWMFFVCIPYASLFTYHCLKKLVPLQIKQSTVRIIINVLTVFCVVAAIIFHDKAYTFTTAISLAIILVFTNYFLKVKWMAHFLLTFSIILIPFFIVNGLLTGWTLDEAVVNYNNNENVGIRLNTIPVEDVFYGMLLLLTNTIFYEFFLRKQT